MEVSDRQKRIFAAVVMEHIRTGEPVASGAISGRSEIGLSPASIRKVLHELEASGYLERAHSSAGATPTEAGFRFYAEEVLKAGRLPQKVREQIRKEIMSADFAEASLFSFCSRLLSSLTSQMGVVMAPELNSAQLKKLYFVRLERGRVLAVLISQSGIIQNRVLSPPADFSQDELNEVNVLLEEMEEPFTLEKVRADLLSSMGAHRSDFERIFSRALLLAEEAFGGGSAPGGQGLYLDEEGRSRLLEHPDFRDAEAMRGLFRAFENKRRLVELLNEITGGGKLRVVISPSGDDPDGLALVASPYSAGGGEAGALGVLGPRRLNYSETIPVVEYAARVLSGVFSSGRGGADGGK
jgi:heat-inducible transcriptional repressor